MFLLYFVEAGENIPFTICWCEDRFIRKWTSTAASEGSKCLIKSVILKKAEKEQWGRKFFSVINLSGGGKFCGFFGTDCEYVIPYSCVKKIGPDAVLVEIKEEKFLQKY